jgi:hypothetical protein
MPTHEGKDKKGKFVQWGKSGKKYYYKDEQSKKEAIKKADSQASAIYASGYKKK